MIRLEQKSRMNRRLRRVVAEGRSGNCGEVECATLLHSWREIDRQTEMRKLFASFFSLFGGMRSDELNWSGK